MRNSTLILAAGAALALPATAPAQIVPGLRAPESAADAIDDAQSMLCVLAAAGRPMPGLNMNLIGGEGMTQLDRLPEGLAPFVAAAATQQIVQLHAPGDPVWVVNDSATGRCAIYSFTDAAAVEARLLKSLATPKAWKRQEPSGGADHVFEWAIDKPLRLRTEITRPKTPGEPLAVVVTPFRR
jgi:hypothetical protein